MNELEDLLARISVASEEARALYQLAFERGTAEAFQAYSDKTNELKQLEAEITKILSKKEE